MLAAKIPKSVETDLSTDPYSSSYITFKKKTLFLEILEDTAYIKLFHWKIQYPKPNDLTNLMLRLSILEAYTKCTKIRYFFKDIFSKCEKIFRIYLRCWNKPLFFLGFDPWLKYWKHFWFDGLFWEGKIFKRNHDIWNLRKNQQKQMQACKSE